MYVLCCYQNLLSAKLSANLLILAAKTYAYVHYVWERKLSFCILIFYLIWWWIQSDYLLLVKYWDRILSIPVLCISSPLYFAFVVKCNFHPGRLVWLDSFCSRGWTLKVLVVLVLWWVIVGKLLVSRKEVSPQKIKKHESLLDQTGFTNSHIKRNQTVQFHL